MAKSRGKTLSTGSNTVGILLAQLSGSCDWHDYYARGAEDVECASLQSLPLVALAKALRKEVEEKDEVSYETLRELAQLVEQLAELQTQSENVLACWAHQLCKRR